MAPRARGIIRLTTARVTLSTPVTLTSSMARRSSSVMSLTGPSRSTPAALTSWSMGPICSSAAATTASTAALSETSTGKSATWRDSARSLATSSASRAASRSTATTVVPCSARSRTTAAPMPPAAPVTSAVCSST